MNETIEIDLGSGNVYADLGTEYADEMLVKAQLAAKIAEIIKGRKLSQQEAAKLLGMTQPKLSNLLRGKLRCISEAKILAITKNKRPTSSSRECTYDL